MSNVAEVKPELIRWAVDRSGLSLDYFPAVVGEWIDDTKKPTFRKLEVFAKKAMVPFGYLFLDKPPIEEIPMPDYRTLRDTGIRRPSPNLLDTIHDMQRRQAWMCEYLIEEGHGSLPIVSSATLATSLDEMVGSFHKCLELERDWALGHATWEAALSFLIRRIESAGVLVFVNGVVGNNTHRKLSVEEFRGFVLSNPIVPLIFVNGADSKAAQMFTLAHELAHVWLGEDALVNLPDMQPGGNSIELFCNRVAAEFLVPETKLRAEWPSVAESENPFRTLATRFKASPVVIARRAKDLRLISAEAFFRFYHSFMEGVRDRKDNQKGGGNFYRTQTARLGRRFSRAVIFAAKAGRITYTEAYRLTGLSGKTLDTFASFLRGQPSE